MHKIQDLLGIANLSHDLTSFIDVGSLIIEDTFYITFYSVVFVILISHHHTGIEIIYLCSTFTCVVC